MQIAPAPYCADGRFTICGIDVSEPVELVVRKDGFGAVGVALSVYPDRTTPVRITLGAGTTVFGTVRDGRGDAVAGAEVFVTPLDRSTQLRPARRSWGSDAFLRTRALTDDAGTFAIRGVPAPSAVTAEARAPSCKEGRSRPHVLAPGERVGIDVVVHRMVDVLVRFVDAATGEALPTEDAKLSLDASWSRSRDDQKSLSVDEERADEEDDDAPRPAFVERFENVLPGRHTVHVSSPHGYLDPPPFPFEFAGEEPPTVTVPLERGRTITGRVLDIDGKPAEVDVSFRADWRGEAQYASAETDAEGRFRIEGVPPIPGELSAYSVARGNTTWTDVAPEGDLGDLRLRPVARVVGRVPPAFRATRLGGSILTARGGGTTIVHTDPDGRLVVRGVPTDRPFTLSIEPKTRAAFVARDLVVGPAGVHDLGEIEFPEGLGFDVRVVDSAGLPVVGVRVGTVEWWGESDGRTDIEGRHALTGLPPGAHTLRVEASDDTTWYQPVDVRSGMSPVTVRLPRLGRLECTFTRSEGRWFAGQPVNVYRFTADGEPDWNRRVIAETDSRGVLSLDLFPGVYGLHPHGSTGITGPEPALRFEVKEGATVERTVALD